MKKQIVNEVGEKVYDFISKYIDFENDKACIVSTTTRFNIECQYDNHYTSIVNLKRINDIRRINKFFHSVNSKLPTRGLFIGCVETSLLRKLRIIKKYPIILGQIYYFFDFIFKRIFPKLPVTKQMYFFLTEGRNRVISRAETIGRLYSCGFEVVEEELINRNLFFVTRKIKEPFFDDEPTYGPLTKLKRIGKNGKIIKVYKMRTMYPYSEYLQDYVYNKNRLQEGGKFKNDFRINPIGRFMRKFWIDELPMIFNLIKGDLKLVGVRPLSEHYLSLYSEEIKQKRLKHKPGLIPPFYVDMPKTLEEIITSELRYFEKYERSPFKTDFIYFFKALRNIIFKRARSK